jgi:uncharacterized membrane protein
MLEDLLRNAAAVVVPALDGIALAIVVLGTLATLVRVMHAVLAGAHAAEARDIWVGYARWLVAALTFQVAADIVGTSLAPSWDEIGRLAAIAAIRTFLDFFLERDLEAAADGRRSRASAVKRTADGPAFSASSLTGASWSRPPDSPPPSPRR